MRRSLIGVVVVCLLAAVGASAAPYGDGRLELRRGKEDPIARVIRVVKKVVGSLGDGLGGPKP